MRYFYTWHYFFIVTVIIIPLNILMISGGRIQLGSCLIIAQIPWYILFFIKQREEKRRKKEREKRERK